VLVGLDGFFISRKSEISPSSSTLIGRSIGINDVPLRSLLLHELLDFFSKCFCVFIGVVFDSFEVKNIRLVLLGVFVDLASSVLSEGLVIVYPV